MYSIPTLGFGLFPTIACQRESGPWLQPHFSCFFFFFSPQQHLLLSPSQWRESCGSPFGWLHSRSDSTRGGCWHTVALLYDSGFSREREPVGDMYVHIYICVYYKLLTHVMMEAEQSHDLLSASWDQGSRWCGSKAWEPESWGWRCQFKSEGLSTRSVTEHRR